MKKYYKTTLSTSVEELLSLFPYEEFKSPFRSTVALINYVEHGSFLKVINADYDDTKIVYEYEVQVLEGFGRPSCSDLLVQTQNTSYIIEAKRTETKYDTVSEWRSGSENKELVLSGWLQLISNYTNEEIDLKEILNVPYQMIHRIASACSLKTKINKVIYLCFDLNSEMRKYYKDNINKMCVLTNNKIDIILDEISIKKKSMQINLEELWNNGFRDLSMKVIKGTKLNLLMDFEQI